MTLTLVTLCTGNAARSVMAGMMLQQLGDFEGLDLDVITAGTHAIEGQPMSIRTRRALETIDDLDMSRAIGHRSHQLTPSDVDVADVIVGMEADHVAYVRRVHPGAATKTVTLRRLVADLGVEATSFEERLAAMDVSAIDLSVEIDVVDPAGGEQEDYDRCAAEIWELCQVLVTLLGDDRF
jgi:protein-tyrosine-phosphatase